MTTLKLLLATDYGLMSLTIIVVVVGFGAYCALKPRKLDGSMGDEPTRP